MNGLEAFSVDGAPLTDSLQQVVLPWPRPAPLALGCLVGSVVAMEVSLGYISPRDFCLAQV
eukprot:9959043-Alexandrium_andersonii.AAC.1